MAMSDRHPSAERLAEYIDDRLAPADRAEVVRHLADCADCRELVSETMDLIVAEERNAEIIAEENRADAPTRVPPFRSPQEVRGVAAWLAAARHRRWMRGAAAGLAAA